VLAHTPFDALRLTVCTPCTLRRRRNRISRRRRRRPSRGDNTIRPWGSTRPLVVEEEASNAVRRTGSGGAVRCRLDLRLGEGAACCKGEGEEGETHVVEMSTVIHRARGDA
jgi:hypothetical protein